MVAQQQNLVDGRTDPTGRAFDQAQPQVVRRIVDAIQITGEPAVGRGNHDATGVRKLVARGVVVIAEADCFREPVDGLLVAGQKMPALGRSVSTVRPRVMLLFLGGQLRRLAGIEADRHDLVVTTDFERNRLAALEKSIQHLRAEHRTAVIDQGQHDRLFRKIIAQPYFAPRLVAEYGVERQRRIEVLLDADVAKQFGRRTLAGRRVVSGAGRKALGCRRPRKCK